MKTNIRYLKSGGTILESLLVMSYALILVLVPISTFFKRTCSEQSEIPFEISRAIEGLEKGDGWIHIQRADIEKVSKALKDGVITSLCLRRDGDAWIAEQTLRVNIREALVFWAQIKGMESKASFGFKKSAIMEAEKLALLIEEKFDAPYAKEEGLTISKAQIELALYHISHHGMEPPPSLSEPQNSP